jgi:hypothetical protein
MFREIFTATWANVCKELVEFLKVYVKGSLVLTVSMISDSKEDGHLQVNKVLQHLLLN